MKKPFLSLQNLSKFYTPGQSVVMALNHINLNFRAGEFIAITGESGSGKSTLSRVMAGIIPYESGEMLVNGQPTSHYDSRDWELFRCRSVSYISQSYDILPGSTVLGNILAALRMTGMDPNTAQERADGALRQVGLWELKDRRAAKLSSGQKQRLAIARALAKPAKILIADEPTGNLDPENSRIVVQLLAQAARERLVIMVTHDFDEVAELATRRIVLRDGAVVSEQELRPATDTAEAPATYAVQTRKGLGRYTAKLQVKSHPMWSALVTAFLGLTIFAVFAFAGTFIMSLDETPTYDYDNSAFQNGDPRRIVVCRPDGADLTQEDLDALLGVKYVESMEEYGYLADIQYAWQEDVDHTIKYSVQQAGGIEGVRQKISSVSFDYEQMDFAKTVPIYQDGREFLTEGRLPESAFEVVAAGDESMIGQTITVFFQDTKYWAQKYYWKVDVTVVGVTEEGTGLYFHRDVGRVFLSNIRIMTKQYNFYLLVPSATLTGNAALLESTQYQRYKGRYESDTFKFNAPYLDSWTIYEGGTLLCSGAHDSTNIWVMEVAYDVFDVLAHQTAGDQVSLFIQDYAYTDEVLEELYGLGFAAISPYREGSVIPNRTLANQRVQTLRICLIALAVVVVLLVVLLRAMFGLQKEEYRLLRNIGLDGASASRSIWWQMLAFALGGQILGWTFIGICHGAGIEAIARLLRYLPMTHRVILTVIHGMICALGALWVSANQKMQLFPNDGAPADLDWPIFDEEVEA